MTDETRALCGIPAHETLSHHLHNKKMAVLQVNALFKKAAPAPAKKAAPAKKGLFQKKAAPAPKKAALLDQQRSMFRPRIQGLFVGQDFAMRNSDPIIHNVRSLSQENRPFNIAQPAGTPDRLKRFSDQEGPIELRCDYHRWMRAFIFVMKHPFFDVTDTQGRFSIKNLPPGEYTLATWHESFGENKQTLKVGGSGLNNANFTYKAKKGLNFE